MSLTTTNYGGVWLNGIYSTTSYNVENGLKKGKYALQENGGLKSSNTFKISVRKMTLNIKALCLLIRKRVTDSARSDFSL